MKINQIDVRRVSKIDERTTLNRVILYAEELEARITKLEEATQNASKKTETTTRKTKKGNK